MAVKAWEAERDLAKQERRRPAWCKPKLEGIEAPLEWPKKLEDGESDDEEDKGMQPNIDEDEDPQIRLLPNVDNVERDVTVSVG